MSKKPKPGVKLMSSTTTTVLTGAAPAATTPIAEDVVLQPTDVGSIESVLDQQPIEQSDGVDSTAKEDEAAQLAREAEEERQAIEAQANVANVATTFASEVPVETAVQVAPLQSEAERQVDTAIQTYLKEMHPAKYQTAQTTAIHQKNFFAFLVFAFTNFDGDELRKAFFRLKNHFADNRKPGMATALCDEYLLRDVPAAFADRNYQAGMNIITLLVNASSLELAEFVKGTTLNIPKLFEADALGPVAAERFLTMLGRYK